MNQLNKRFSLSQLIPHFIETHSRIPIKIGKKSRRNPIIFTNKFLDNPIKKFIRSRKRNFGNRYKKVKQINNPSVVNIYIKNCNK